ncbi:hypothetical protein [Nonomuraea rhodomycinica]|uniref:hypothetical protein n=1 Tax=Nonomuraea rhodomycinica TaxID=1712872 RepID=UPI001FE6987E|nr:hypothetical protein [Nonomuraea rhodomycinica]
MAVFRHSAESLVQLVSESVPERVLSDVIADYLRATQGINPGRSERKSWDRSIPILARDLVEAGLGGVEMLIEYQLPLTSKRADVILAGRDRRTGADSYLIVELKQWSQAELYEDDANMVLVSGMGNRPKLHPVLQVRGYCEYLADFAGALDQHQNAVRGVATCTTPVIRTFTISTITSKTNAPGSSARRVEVSSLTTSRPSSRPSPGLWRPIACSPALSVRPGSC